MKLTRAIAALFILALTVAGCAPAQTEAEPEPTATVPTVLAGDTCTTYSQAIIEVEGGSLECRLFAGNVLKYVQVSNNPVPPIQTLNTSSMKTCQLKDNISIPGIYTGGSVGYPAVGEFPSVGKMNVAVVPVDFSDHPSIEDASWLQEQIDTADDWVTRFSNGNLALNWQFANKWIRAPKESKFYNFAHSSFQADGSTALDGDAGDTNLQSTKQMVNQLFTAAEEEYDFANVEYVFFVFPKDIGTNIWHGPDNRNFPVKTTKGSYQLGFSFTSGALHQMGKPWHSWLHEFLHSAGLRGHAPGNEYMYNIMAWDSGPGKALTAWDSFILGWLNKEQVACYDLKSLKQETVVLTSMDSALPGVRTAIIRLSNHEAIVVESRRRDVYSAGLPYGFYGVQAYFVDTLKGEGRYDWAMDRETEMKYFAYFLWVDAEDHGVGKPDVMNSSGPMEPGNLNMNGYVGDTFTYKNLQIAVTNTGDFDTVTLTKG